MSNYFTPERFGSPDDNDQPEESAPLTPEQIAARDEIEAEIAALTANCNHGGPETW